MSANKVHPSSSPTAGPGGKAARTLELRRLDLTSRSGTMPLSWGGAVSPDTKSGPPTPTSSVAGATTPTEMFGGGGSGGGVVVAPPSGRRLAFDAPRSMSLHGLGGRKRSSFPHLPGAPQTVRQTSGPARNGESPGMTPSRKVSRAMSRKHSSASQPGGGHRASGAWYTNVQRVLAQQKKKKKEPPKILSIFRDKQRQLSLKKARGRCMKGLTDLRNSIQVFMLSTAFNGLLAVLIIANAVLLGFVVDYQAQCLKTESETACIVFESDRPGGGGEFTLFDVMRRLNVADIAFTTVFGVELLTKMFGFGRDFWKFAWNIFDFCIITISAVEASASLYITSSAGDDSSLLTIVPVLRTLRVLRVLRVLRLVNMFVDLSILVKSAAFSARPAAWVVFLGTLFTYIFAILTTRLFGQADPAEVVNHVQLVEWFGTVPRSMYSMFQVMTLESWSMGIVRVVMEDFPYAPILFITWIVVMSIGVLNLLAAVFVNSYMQCSRTVANDLRSSGNSSNAHKIKVLKKLLQCNTDEYLSQEDFIERVQGSYELAHALQDLVSAERVAKAFQCINVDDTGGKASFDDLFQIALSLDEAATKEDINHTWLLLAHYAGAMVSKIEHMERVVTDQRTVQKLAETAAEGGATQLQRAQAAQLVRQALELFLGWLPDQGAGLLRRQLDIDATGDPVDADRVDWVEHPELLHQLAERLLNSPDGGFATAAGGDAAATAATVGAGHAAASNAGVSEAPRRASNTPMFVPADRAADTPMPAEASPSSAGSTPPDDEGERVSE